MRNVPHITMNNRVLFEGSLRGIQSNSEQYPAIHTVDDQRFVFLSDDDAHAYARVVEAALDWQKR